MKTPINQQVEKTIEALSKNTATQAGQTTSDSPLPQKALVDAISQLFAEFELVYHNQYTKAFGTSEKLNYAKRLWYSHLKHYSADIILKAAKVATRQSEYLPSVYTMVSACDLLLEEAGIPSTHNAYREACLATAPKAAYAWSHPIVYFAGRDTGWQYLHESPERVALPVFTEHYLRWRTKAQQGEKLEIVLPPPQAKNTKTKRKPKAEQQQKLAELRKNLGL